MCSASNVVVNGFFRVDLHEVALQVNHAKVEKGRTDAFEGCILKLTQAQFEEFPLLLFTFEAKCTLFKVGIEVFGVRKAGKWVALGYEP